MKTIFVKTNDNRAELTKFIHRLEKHADKVLNNPVICERYLDTDNYNTIMGELKDAVAIDDFDIFIIGVDSKEITTLNVLENINRAHTLTCEVDDFNSAKNFIVML